jgi:hypothetical protein
MLVAYRLAGLSALETYYAGVSACAQSGTACGCVAHLGRLVQMAAQNRILARNSKLGDDGPVTSLGNPYRRVRVGPRDGP